VIDTQAIRKKVLDLALRGKLTEQLPEDGTTELLLKELRLSKEKYERNAGNKKTNMSYVQDGEPPFEIPDSWMWVQMGEVFSHNTGKALNTSVQKGTLLDYITTSNVYWDRFELSSLKSMYFTDDEIEKCTIRKEDLLICEGGDIGRSSIWPFDTEMRIQNHIHRLRSYLPSIDVKLYYYVMRYYKMKGLISGRGIGLEGFSSKRLHNLTVPLMPTDEQHRIVVKIDAIFSLLDTIDTLQSQYQDNLATLKNKIIDAGIQGKLTEQLPEDGTAEELYQQIQQEKLALEKAGKIKKSKPLPPITDEEKPFDIPENWKWVRLGDFYSFTNGTASRGTPGGSPHPVLRLADLTSGKIKCDNIRSIDLSDSEFDSHKLLCNDLVFVRVNGSRDRVAAAYRYSEDDEISYCDHLFCGHSVSERINPDYIVYVFGTANIRAQLEPEIKTTAGQNTISQNPLKSVLIPLPPLAEQKRIVAKLEELLPLCEG